MRLVIKHILKEEYNTKLKDFVYSYFDKKIESGEWRWSERDYNIFLIKNEDNLILLELEKSKKSKKSKSLWVYKEIYDKFIKGFSIEWNDFKPIITSYVENKLNIEGIDTNQQGYNEFWVVENILKEEHNLKLKNFIYSYFDKKIESGKWKWIEKNGDTFLIDSDKYTIILEYGLSKNIWLYYDKFIKYHSIELDDFEKIIKFYVEDRLNVEVNQVISKMYWSDRLLR